jgi:hypothetical protein
VGVTVPRPAEDAKLSRHCLWHFLCDSSASALVVFSDSLPLAELPLVARLGGRGQQLAQHRVEPPLIVVAFLFHAGRITHAMSRRHEPNPSSVTAGALSDAALLAIGRIVRNCAELEDMAMLFVCSLTTLSEAKVLLMLGRNQVTRNIEIATQLARHESSDAASAFLSCFNQDYEQIRSVRNDVAHGVFLGFAYGGDMTFISRKTLGTGEVVMQAASCFSLAELEKVSEVSAGMVSGFPAVLQIKALRETRSQQFLQPRPKGRP